MVVEDSPSFDHPWEGEIWGELSGADVGGRVLEVDRAVPGQGANGEEECQQCSEQGGSHGDRSSGIKPY